MEAAEVELAVWEARLSTRQTIWKTSWHLGGGSNPTIDTDAERARDEEYTARINAAAAKLMAAAARATIGASA